MEAVGHCWGMYRWGCAGIDIQEPMLRVGLEAPITTVHIGGFRVAVGSLLVELKLNSPAACCTAAHQPNRHRSGWPGLHPVGTKSGNVRQSLDGRGVASMLQCSSCCMRWEGGCARPSGWLSVGGGSGGAVSRLSHPRRSPGRQTSENVAARARSATRPHWPRSRTAQGLRA